MNIYYWLPEWIRDYLKPHSSLQWYFARNSYLQKKGWVRSDKKNIPVDQDGGPLPWYTYPAIDFIEPRLKSDFRVFEYGSGHSSLWYSRRVKEVVSVEDSKEWASEMTDRAPENVEIVYQPDLDQYPLAVSGRGVFDIVVIDGQVRKDCIEPALNALEETGIVILDDFERWEPDDWAHLDQKGFRPLPFFGPKAQRLTESCTAILYRDQNSLQI